MARSRHKHVRPLSRRRRLARAGLAAGAVLALGVPTAAVAWPDSRPEQVVPLHRANAVRIEASPVPMRLEPISRSATRVQFTHAPSPRPSRPTGHLFATAAVNVRAEPSGGSPRVGALRRAQKVPVTGERVGQWTEVVLDKSSRWVHSDYLAPRRPAPAPRPEPKPVPVPEPGPAPAPAPTPASPPTAAAAPAPAPTPVRRKAPARPGLSTAPCPTGSAPESGLAPNAVAAHRAVCAAFPQVTTYYGVRPGDPGEHGTGRALDIMVTGATGDRIAAFARTHSAALGVSEVIWSQRIWTVQRSSEGWRWMEDRGSTTANHYDHVHLTVY